METTTNAEAPNIVLIYMDDMTAWALRSSQVATPHLDRLRARGTTFANAFNQGSLVPAVCTPARQMLMSGLSVFDAAERFLDVPRLGKTLTDSGYDTFFTGKWHNETEALEADYATVGPWAGGMLGTLRAEDDAYGRPRDDDAWDPADERRGGHWMTLPDGRVQHSSVRWTEAALGFLRERASGESSRHTPFFLHLAYHAPHDPRQAPADMLDRYPVSDIRVPPNAMREHPFDNGDLFIRDELLAPHPRTPDAIRLHRREYFAILSHADAQIGRVLDEVETMDQQSDRATIVVFSGDHGLALGEHGLLGKQNLYDHSTRVPLVFAGPGIDEGVTYQGDVYSGSIFATICDLTGVVTPAHVQFPSLARALCGGDAGEAAIFTAYAVSQRSIRQHGMKLIAYADSSDDQLFDMSGDPWELSNVIGRDEHRALVGELRRSLADAQVSLHDPALSLRAKR